MTISETTSLLIQAIFQGITFEVVLVFRYASCIITLLWRFITVLHVTCRLRLLNVGGILEGVFSCKSQLTEETQKFRLTRG